MSTFVPWLAPSSCHHIIQTQHHTATMGLSLSRLYSSLGALARWGKEKEVRILMVGLDSAGKVSCVLGFRLSWGLFVCVDGDGGGLD
jgi:hypothetical protein